MWKKGGKVEKLSTTFEATFCGLGRGKSKERARGLLGGEEVSKGGRDDVLLPSKGGDFFS